MSSPFIIPRKRKKLVSKNNLIPSWPTPEREKKASLKWLTQLLSSALRQKVEVKI